MGPMLFRNDILRLVKELDFLGEDCWMTSGAALVLYGVKESTRDIDLICTTELADKWEKQGVPFRLDGLDGTRIFQINDQVEVLENWHTEEVIELDGLPIASLLSIRRQKEALGREKDLADIRLIDRFLEQNTGRGDAFMFAVAIDGPAGAGKSSVARAAARELGFVYVDTGALYRTVALYLLEHEIPLSDPAAVEAALPGIEVGLECCPEGQKMFLCGREVTGLIRTPEMSMAASACSAIPAVRSFLLGLQRELAKKNNVLMDGRDIGTVVLPQAQLKVFLTASAEERARRRVGQLEESGRKVDFQQILREIQERDYQDSHRAAAPLKQAEDAVLLDTSDMTFEEAADALIKLVKERF